MNGVRKTEILLQCLDRTLVVKVLALLPNDHVDVAIRASVRADTATSDELNSVLREFKLRFNALPIATPMDSGLHREVKLNPYSQPAAEQDASLPITLSQLVRPEPPVSPPEADSGEGEPGPFDFLTNRHPDDIRQLLVDEQPQTIAVIAAQLSPSLSASVLAGLPPDCQADVLQRVARLGPTDPEILSDIAAALKSRLGRARVRSGGVTQAAGVLRQSSRTATRSLLSSLDEQDSDLADELRQTLFSFDDLLKLDDDTLRVILRETDDRQWALALKASPEPVRQKVLGCLSPHVAHAFKNEMDSLGPVRLSEMTSVRQQIADSIHRLESSGLITLPLD